jgi:hypothetical protein
LAATVDSYEDVVTFKPIGRSTPHHEKSLIMLKPNFDILHVAGSLATAFSDGAQRCSS